jgi:hypothetical protein
MVKKCLVCYLACALFVVGICPRLDAAFSPSDALGLSSAARAGDMEKIRTALENRLVTQRLRDLGYTSDEVIARMSAMSDNQVHAFAMKLDQAKVGGELGIIIAVLVIIVLVLLIIRLTGHRGHAR